MSSRVIDNIRIIRITDSADFNSLPFLDHRAICALNRIVDGEISLL